MVDTAYLLGIDVGTTGTKALLIETNGRVAAAATREYPLQTPRPGWAEQDPEDWWRAAAACIQDVMRLAGARPGQIAGVGLTGQMHGAVLLGRDGRVLRPCILWNDQRSADQCAEITRRIGADRVIQLTGNPVLAGFTAPKLLWVRQNEPEVFNQIESVLLPKDYVRYRLTGGRFTDVSDASGTSLFDVANRRWSQEMIDAVGVRRSWLAEATESPEVSSAVNRDGAREMHLAAGTPVVGGAGDQAAQAVGTGIVSEGPVSATLGTSGVVFAASNAYRVEPAGKLHAFCHAVPGMWHLMGVMLSAGGSLRWYRDTLCDGEKRQAASSGIDPYEIMTEAAAAAPAGCEGLLFLPYLTGERTPHADPQARGVFFGLTLRHTKAHLTRSILEGVAFGLRDSLELMKGLGLDPTEVRTSGGGARSPLWRRILADVFDCAIATVNVTDGAAYGAALLAGVGAGAFSSVRDAADRTIRVIDSIDAGADVDAYDRAYGRFRALYPALAEQFKRA